MPSACPVISARDIERFTRGDCLYLARALQQRTGWPIHSFEFAGSPCLHAFVLMPDGRGLDVNGARGVTELSLEWAGDWEGQTQPTREFAFADVRDNWGPPKFGAATYSRAQRVADALLQTL
jgi:hypothetical protein